MSNRRFSFFIVLLLLLNFSGCEYLSLLSRGPTPIPTAAPGASLVPDPATLATPLTTQTNVPAATLTPDVMGPLPPVVVFPSASPFPSLAPTLTPTPRVTSNKIIGGYLPNWAGYPKKLQDFDPIYNTIFLFSASPTGNGNVSFDLLGGTFVQDCKTFRAQGKKLILTVGGANRGFGLNSRQESNNFIASFSQIYTLIGGLDGLDWDNFEASQVPTTDEMIYVSQRLKNKYGPNFTISCPPAPWRDIDQQFAVAMKNAGVLDFAGPQFYDGDGLNNAQNVLNYIQTWVGLLGQDKVVVGYGVSDAANYWTGAGAAASLKSILKKYPNIHGVFDWEINYDNSNGNPFSRQVAPIFIN